MQRLVNAEILLGPQDTFDFRLLAESTGDVLCRIGMDMVFRYVSPACTHVLGWKPEEMIGRSPGDFVASDDVAVLAAAITLGLHAGIQFSPLTVGMRRPDESTVSIEVASRILRSPENGESPEVVFVLRDVTARTEMEDRLFTLALTDSLTGLFNRRGFDIALERDWRRTLREQSQMSLLLLDLDRFKQYNDLKGNQAGDDCLRIVASTISSCVHRATDTVARYGGEELAIILPCTDARGAQDMAESLRSAILDLRLPHNGNPDAGCHVSASIGAATAVIEDGAEVIDMPRHLILSADTALYKAKREGRNRVVARVLAVAPPA
jgi:diguanylate cyclase (GGDEF)-like protein/PAS domain S-box-containing protein